MLQAVLFTVRRYLTLQGGWDDSRCKKPALITKEKKKKKLNTLIGCFINYIIQTFKAIRAKEVRCVTVS